MTIAGVVFVVIGLYISIVAQKHLRPVAWIPIPLYGFHTGLCLLYAVDSYGTVADSYEYYRTASSADLRLGADGIGWLTWQLQEHLGATYIDCFLFFQLFGFAGMLLFASSGATVLQSNPSTAGRRILITSLFLPGFSYWSCALGKDPIAVLAVGLVLYGSTRNQLLLVATGCGLMFAIRPHIAVLMLVSLGTAAVLARSRWSASRALLVLASGGAVIAAIPIVLAFAGLSSLSTTTVRQDLDVRLEENAVGGGALDVSAAPIWIKWFSYFFRPYLGEASTLLAVVASIENLILLILFAFGVRAFMQGPKSEPFRSQVSSFCTIFGVFCGILISFTLSNLGIALRQKYMFVPPMLLLTILLITGRNVRALAATQRVASRRGQHRGI